jgi:protein-S-isoprenylcysteine O-methyltransferase Ste14
MINPTTPLLLLNLLYIGILPRIFFRKDGRLGPMWWATAAPFIATAACLIAHLPGAQQAAVSAAYPLAALRELAAVTLSALSIALISLALGTHRVPVSLWHQETDAPQVLVTVGAYRRIRHPFYAAFLLVLAAAFLHLPQPLTLAAFGYGWAMLNATAMREERRLAAAFGAQYRAYMARTGRFFPKWGRNAA